MAVGDADNWGVPLRHPRPTDVNPGGSAIGAFPRGPLCFLQGSLQQGTSSVVCQTGHAGESTSDINRSGIHQGKEWEYSVPLVGSRGHLQVSHIPDTCTKVIRVDNTDIGVSRDGQVFSISVPGPIESKDIAHVALAAETRGARLSDEPSPLVAAVLGGKGMGEPGELQVFPHLQLVPPHCHSCWC